jgi:hypothetical protein
MGPERTERTLTVEECERLAATLSEDGAALPAGPKKETLLKLSESYRVLAQMKRTVLRTAN